jgi:hypothetical protein
MKLTFRYITIAFAAILLLNACKKDLGNYSYTTVNIPEIDTAGMGGPKYVERYKTLNIHPAINYENGNKAALKYEWIIYPYTVGSTTTIIPPRQLATTLSLDAAITEKVGEYRLELIVTDTVNKLKANVVFPVTVSVGIEYGVMVLHTKDDSSDVDFLITADAVPVAGIMPGRLRNIYAASTGERFPGVPRFIAQERRSFSTQNWIVLGSDQHLSRMNGADFSLMREDKSFFRRADAVVAPEAYMMLNNSNSAFINNGKLHLFTTVYEIDALFGGAVPGDYELAPYLAHATSFGLTAVVYDKKNYKFIHPASMNGSMIDFIAPAENSNHAFDLRNIGKEMLYMDRGFNSYTHAFFKDRTGAGYWLYVANFNKSDDGNLVIGAYDMSNLPDVANAKFFQSSELGYVDFYATGRSIYSYDYQGTNTATLVFDALPAGETITCMKIYKPRPNSNLSTVEGRLLYVATWNGTEGKVYEFALNGISGQITTPALNVFDGFGKITDLSAKARGAGTY